ncbi:MAG TPA: PaaI family thioesterase [Nevskiaceae bacterium]|nr:PaaI family thioesterase [Nevskiaceae bacterium]
MNADAPDIDTPEASTFRASLHDRYSRFIPHSAALGMTVEAIGTRKASGRLHCRPEFVGDPDRGLIHNGVIISLIDSTFGCAVNSRIGSWQRIATLDLRVDYLRPALLGADILCEAECYRLARHIAFVRASVWQEDAPEAPVAEALATFMRAASRTKALQA